MSALMAVNTWVRYSLITACDRRGMYRTGDAIWRVWHTVRKPFIAMVRPKAENGHAEYCVCPRCVKPADDDVVQS